MNINIKYSDIYKKIAIICLFVMMPTMCFAGHFSPTATYEVCFTPGDDCASKIIKEIDLANKQVLVQAYSFTDISIADALVRAKRRGIDVRVILDKSQIKSRYTLIHFLNSNKIKPLIDKKPAIAHSKIIVVDNQVVIGGSYNFSKSAAKRNAENLVIIKDVGFAKKYVKNWCVREQKSIAFDEV
jgi:phosphatidylserine/phosphatidylglycerophosphate/cardiolipin synthase-like enzyme